MGVQFQTCIFLHKCIHITLFCTNVILVLLEAVWRRPQKQKSLERSTSSHSCGEGRNKFGYTVTHMNVHSPYQLTMMKLTLAHKFFGLDMKRAPPVTGICTSSTRLPTTIDHTLNSETLQTVSGSHNQFVRLRPSFNIAQ